jgi:Flp pilus assembly protein TadG
MARIGKRAVRQRRPGVALVEFALVAPVIFLMFMAFIEFSRFNVTRHSVGEASYEACRAGIFVGATTADVQQAATSLIRANGLRNATVDVTPATLGATTETVTVRVRVPTASNFWIASFFLRNATIESQTTLDHENKIFLLRQRGG